jgi:hypothetical protein
MANAKKTPATKKPIALSENRGENILAFMTAGVIGVSILTMLVTLALLGFGVKVAPVVGVVPVVGLPIGVVLMIALLITNVIRKARQNRR